MKSIRYYVCTCLGCNSPVLVKIDFLEFEKDCCVDFKNLKIMKVFNDEREARNYFKLSKKDDEEEE